MPRGSGPRRVSMIRLPLIDVDTPRHGWAWALALGVVSACGFRPLGIWPLALVAIGLFALLVPAARDRRQAAWWGWLFGMGHFTLGNSWIATAFTYQASMPAMLGWAAVPLLSVYLACYPALAALGARLIVGRNRGLVLALAFAGTWIVTEWLRSWVFTGYAWNPFGIVLLGPMDRPGLAALAPFTGTYALSGLAVLIGTGLVILVRQRALGAAMAIALLLAAGMYWPAGKGREGSLAVTIVQPDIRQHRLSDPLFYEANFNRLAQMSRVAAPSGKRLLLWPESGMVDYLRDGYPQRYYDATTALGSPEYARKRLGRVAGADTILLTGAVDLEIGSHADGSVGATGAYNSVTAIDAEGAIRGGYAKAHLVPYGEYLPMRSLLTPLGLSRLVPGAIDFLPGPGPGTLDLGDHGRAGVQICYEIVFSGQVVDRDDRPDYIFNPSNDGWFGAFGPPQHFAQARLRAVEEGLPVLRATTTGISGIIDARGIVRQHLPMHEMERIDGIIPPAAAPTPFARLGNILPLAWAIVFLLLALVALRRGKS